MLLIDIYKNYCKNLQDPTRELVDPMVEFVLLCPYFELEHLKYLHKEMLEGNEQNCCIRILIYFSRMP